MTGLLHDEPTVKEVIERIVAEAGQLIAPSSTALPEALPRVLASGWKNARQLAFMANGFKAIRIATEEGDMACGVLPVGQVTGLIRDEPTVKEVVERIVAEAAQVREKLAGQLA